MGQSRLVALTPSDIASAQRRLLDNTAALITEAELLCDHGHFARAFFLSVIAMEEASKVLLLLECAKHLAAGQPQDWSKVHKKLTSHTEKLRANLLLFQSMRLGRVPDVDSAEWQDAVARVKEMDLLKQAALYVWVGEGGPSTTNEHIAEDDKAHSAIKLAKLSYNASDLLLREFTARSEGASTVDSQTRYPVEGLERTHLHRRRNVRREHSGEAGVQRLLSRRRSVRHLTHMNDCRPRRREKEH